MKKYYIPLLLLATACTEQPLTDHLTTEAAAEWLGKAVQFEAVTVDTFHETARTTYQANGYFNEGDRMTIYRQYSNDQGLTFTEPLAYRVYTYTANKLTGTNVQLNIQWKIAVGRLGSDNGTETFTQTAADSLSWEKSDPVRFRSWCLSNLSGCLNNTSNWNSYYPDFTIADWVTVSGPTQSIPLHLKHKGCRIGFSPLGGNQLAKVEICTDPDDYLREDNAGSNEADESDKADSQEQAEERANAVKAVYDRMCWPGGVDMETSQLTALSKDYKDTYSSPKDIEQADPSAPMLKFNTLSQAELTKKSVRPVFNGNNGNFYLISIPYDMSNGSDSGQPLVLPAYTRFRVYLRDVNNGDAAQNSSAWESQYHLLSLSDITEANGTTPAFPDGLKLRPGYSFLFRVGYHYGRLTVDTSPSFSWVEQELTGDKATDQTATAPTNPTPYGWWKDAIQKAIDATTATNVNYQPVFHLRTAAELRELAELVNGDKVKPAGQLLRAYRGGQLNSDNNSYYWWYRAKNITDAQGDTLWVSHADAEAEGYLFYPHYFPSDGDTPAYSVDDYLAEAYSFYSDQLRRQYTICLDNDLDLQDVPLPAIGTAEHPFRGYLDGGMHRLYNLFPTGGYLFGHTQDAALTNLRIASTHAAALLYSGTDTQVAGVEVTAPVSGAALAETLTGACYVVGCRYEGQAGKALVGTADNLYMYGCLQTAPLTGTAGALLHAYADPSNPYLASLGAHPYWSRFHCNYYDTTRAPQATAVAGIADSYVPQEYIRGGATTVLCAVQDRLLARKEHYNYLSPSQKKEYYGLAPWKAMNYGIYAYNQQAMGSKYPCKARYTVNERGYDHRYPQLVAGAPENYSEWNVMNQNN